MEANQSDPVAKETARYDRGRSKIRPEQDSRVLRTNAIAPASGKRQPLMTSDVVIERELVGMWPLPDRIHFLGALIVHVGAQQLFGKYVAL